MWTILKVFTEFNIILLLLYVVVVWLRGTWDLNSPTRVEPTPPALEGESKPLDLQGHVNQLGFLKKTP